MHEIAMLRLKAQYNRWMNEKLYAVCAGIDDSERRRDRGAFFRSVDGTLNHLLLVDRLWFARIQGRQFAVKSLDQQLYEDFATLRHERSITDAELCAYVDTLSGPMLAQPVNYTSLAKQQPVSLPLGLVLVHLFNHQTHHRGQITTLLTQTGVAIGDTDMIYMPGAAALMS
jgi:uncharacterized damage-inducible protein DinB